MMVKFERYARGGESVWINPNHVVAVVETKAAEAVVILTSTGVAYEVVPNAGRTVVESLVRPSQSSLGDPVK
jgi:hypothetical protein